MADNTTVPLPPGLAQRPMHPRLRRPIPVVNVHPEGINFRSVNHQQARACAENGWCGLCGRDLDEQIAFLGGPKSAESRIYADPGMHPACAEAAIRLCPHIATRHHRPTPAHRLDPNTVTLSPVDEPKPARWHLGITHDYRAAILHNRLLFFPDPFLTERVFAYDHAGHITEIVH